MSRIIKNTLLQYIPNDFLLENEINPHRIYELNDNNLSGDIVIYLCEREIRLNDNFALQFAIQKAQECNLPLLILHPRKKMVHLPKQNFIDCHVLKVQNEFNKLNLNFEIFEGANLLEYIIQLNPAIIIFDFNPINKLNWINKINSKVYEIDGHNIVPARYVSSKQEYNAATLRRKIYNNIFLFLTKPIQINNIENEAYRVLDEFIQNKLPYYADLKNNPIKNMTSDLSKYLNLGLLSSQRVAIDVINSSASDINKEMFLEELIVRKELSDNFCLYSKNFKSLIDIPGWAKDSLNKHMLDFRPYMYSLNSLETGLTHDKLWNATQMQLIKEGKIHGYLRMYWAKKILEWSASPDLALKNAIYLNDKYAYDAPSSNGYVGILWAIGGLHDRAFQDWNVTGKIRRMSFNSIKNKYNIDEYICKYLK